MSDRLKQILIEKSVITGRGFKLASGKASTFGLFILKILRFLLSCKR